MRLRFDDGSDAAGRGRSTAMYVAVEAPGRNLRPRAPEGLARPEPGTSYHRPRMSEELSEKTGTSIGVAPVATLGAPPGRGAGAGRSCPAGGEAG